MFGFYDAITSAFFEDWKFKWKRFEQLFASGIARKMQFFDRFMIFGFVNWIVDGFWILEFNFVWFFENLRFEIWEIRKVSKSIGKFITNKLDSWQISLPLRSLQLDESRVWILQIGCVVCELLTIFFFFDIFCY
jgi:hypothetical protein